MVKEVMNGHSTCDTHCCICLVNSLNQSVLPFMGIRVTNSMYTYAGA